MANRNNPFFHAKSFLYRRGCRGSKSIYICHAIQDAQDKNLITFEQAIEATKLVMRRLNGHKTVGSWVHKEIPHGEKATQQQIQEFRMRWLEQLCKGWNKGQRT